MSTRRTLATILTCGSLLAVSSATHALFIDSFDADDFMYMVGPSPQPVVGQSENHTTPGPVNPNSPNILGGERSVTTTITATGTNAFVTAIVGGGLLSLTNSDSSNSEVIVSWSNFTGVNLAGGGSVALELAFPQPVDGDLTVRFDVKGGASTSSYAQIVPNGSIGNFLFPFSAFSNPGVFSSVDEISMSLSDGLAWDASIDYIRTRDESTPGVPLPGTLLLLMSGFLGLALRRPWRARAAARS